MRIPHLTGSASHAIAFLGTVIATALVVYSSLPDTASDERASVFDFLYGNNTSGNVSASSAPPIASSSVPSSVSSSSRSSSSSSYSSISSSRSSSSTTTTSSSVSSVSSSTPRSSSSSSPGFCGDGTTQSPRETCDLGSKCEGTNFSCAGDWTCTSLPNRPLCKRVESPTCMGCRIVTPSSAPYCGDGSTNRALGEECDDGKVCDSDSSAARVRCDTDADCGLFVACKPVSNDGCNADCKEEFCGDGVTQPEQREQCDIGGHCMLDRELSCTTHTVCRDMSGDANDRCIPDNIEECTLCKTNVCGDGVVVSPYGGGCDNGKHCTDGLRCNDEADCYRRGLADSSCVPRSGDGCSASCELELCGDGKTTNVGRCNNTGPYCSQNETCPDGTKCPIAEECDSGRVQTSTCNANCTTSRCGDTIVNPLTEKCDDGAHCADATPCTLGSACADGSACIPRGPTPTQPFGNKWCTASCQPLIPLKCCTCYYEEHPECAGRTENTCEHYDCKDKQDNDKDGKVDEDDPDCTFVFGDPDASESIPGIQRNDCDWKNGKCDSRFKYECDRNFADYSCSISGRRTLPDGPVVPYPSEPVCTSQQDFWTGHSGPSECNTYVNEIQDCIECSTTQCQSYIRTGCSTFSNLEAARSMLPSIQRTMRRHGIRSKIEISGNQMLASNQCTSNVKFIVSEDGIEEEYGPCDFGEFCYEHGEHFRCKKPDGTITDASCCINPQVLYPPFIRMDGAQCPTPYTEGTCSGVGSAFFCSPGATVAAWTNANVECTIAEKQCLAAHPGGQFSRSCDGEKLSSTWVPPLCTWKISCDWTCTP